MQPIIAKESTAGTERRDFKYIKIKEYLLRLIQDNGYKEEYKLPSENQLALRFHVSRATAKFAISELEKEGLVWRRRGAGTFAREQRNHGGICTECKPIAFYMPDSESVGSELTRGAMSYCMELGVPLLLISGDGGSYSGTFLMEIARQKNIAGIAVLNVNGGKGHMGIVTPNGMSLPVMIVDDDTIRINGTGQWYSLYCRKGGQQAFDFGRLVVYSLINIIQQRKSA